ncbi:MAG: CoA transferase, partial [Pseudomonadota bacterium]
MLERLRAIDLTDERGIFCGYMLAHFGCEVLAVEPPGGSHVRRLPPFMHDDPNRGLWWEAYARGKQSLTCDIQTPAGREHLLELARNADFLIHCFTAKEAAALDLAYDTLAESNPKLIVVSITPFGATGPKADWPATDLTIWAAGGAHVLAGDADRAPVRTSMPQAFLHAGADAVGGALIAFHERHRSGLGQWVDVSAQQSSAQAALAVNLTMQNNSGYEIQREAGGLRGVFPIRLTWPSSDGYMAITLLFGPAFSEPNRRFLRWVHEEGYCTAADAEKDWGQDIADMALGNKPPDEYFELCAKIEQFTRQRSSEYLFEEGVSRGVYIAPALNVQNLVNEKHFQARGYWEDLLVEGASDAVKAPGAFAKLSKSPLRRLGVAPRVDNNITPQAREVEPTTTRGNDSDLPLSGVKVLDFMWVFAGPLFTRALSDFGATVIKVESSTRLDPARAGGPMKDGVLETNRGMTFNNFNAGKWSITLDPANPMGREIILDLVRWADVVTESFSPKAMRGWGLDYESLKQVNPEIIMVSSCLMGQTGPRAMTPGYGNMAAALTGFYDLTGWQDRSPAGPYLAYTDGVAPRFLVATLLGALDHKRRTGEGQLIDLSQAEAAIHFLAPAILDQGFNGHVWSRMGNRDISMAPHGVYPTLGEDQWIAIACQSDEAWQMLCNIMKFSELANDQTLAVTKDRLDQQDRLDAAISAWTIRYEADDIQVWLIDAGIAAHIVQNSSHSDVDPQFIHRNHFQGVPNTSVGNVVVEGPRFRLSRTPGRVAQAGPDLGEHGYQEWLGPV